MPVCVDHCRRFVSRPRLHRRAIKKAALAEAGGAHRAAVVAVFISQRHMQNALTPLVVVAPVAQLLAGRSIDLNKLLYFSIDP